MHLNEMLHSFCSTVTINWLNIEKVSVVLANDFLEEDFALPCFEPILPADESQLICFCT